MEGAGLEVIRMTGSWATQLSLIVTHCRVKESELFNECVCVCVCVGNSDCNCALCVLVMAVSNQLINIAWALQ